MAQEQQQTRSRDVKGNKSPDGVTKFVNPKDGSTLLLGREFKPEITGKGTDVISLGKLNVESLAPGKINAGYSDKPCTSACLSHKPKHSCPDSDCQKRPNDNNGR